MNFLEFQCVLKQKFRRVKSLKTISISFQILMRNFETVPSVYTLQGKWEKFGNVLAEKNVNLS